MTKSSWARALSYGLESCMQKCKSKFTLLLDPCLTRVGPWLICWFLWTIGELLVGSFLDRIGFLGRFVIGLSIGMVCVIAVL